jgi:hypothetical protein
MENENIIPFLSSMGACESSLFLLTKRVVSGPVGRIARLKPYFSTFKMKNFKI